MDEITLAIAQLTFLTLKEKLVLRKNIDSLDKLALLSIEDISSIVMRAVKPDFWNGDEIARQARLAAAVMQKTGIKGILFEEEKYPALLRETFFPPYALFYRGNIDVLAKQCISVVGTRKISREGAEAAFSFAKDAARDGRTVISGLAFGTDTFAHKGAVEYALENNASGTTAAVIPCGIDAVVPYANRALASRILKTGGCILSEYIPGVGAEPWRFVQRNRIIAALSPATVVIQAPPGSGALITADFALEYNRDLLFHSACLCDNAKSVDKAVAKKLSSPGVKGAKVKLERNTERFLEEGAPVINNYADYVLYAQNAPGTVNCKKEIQPELF